MPGTPDTRSPETILAFDFGLRRIGVAAGQDVTGTANPVATVRNADTGPDWRAISSIVSEWCPARLVVGMPLREDGSPSEMTGHIRHFAHELGRFGLPVEIIDERYSSLEANEALKSERAIGQRGRVSKQQVDSLAAAVIAQRWLKKNA